MLNSMKYYNTNNKSAADDFENLVTKIWKISKKDSLIVNKVENIAAKGEIAHHEQFILWPQCFQNCLPLLHQNASTTGKDLKHYFCPSIFSYIYACTMYMYIVIIYNQPNVCKSMNKASVRYFSLFHFSVPFQCEQ